MKRIHLFEFEDFNWFPSSIRDCLTRYLVTFHKLLNTKEQLADLVEEGLTHTDNKQVIDLCSGSGGPMLMVKDELKKKYPNQSIKFIFSDLYPHKKFAKEINDKNDESISYLTEPVNATDVSENLKGLRTMICSMHHMKPDTAKSILKNAKEDKQPILIYEISDNGYPIWLWWTAIPFAFIMVFFITPMIRPMTWQQLVFTYLIPIIPLAVAWDGAVSNARTYTLNDMDILLEGLQDNYTWKKGTLKGKGGKKLYLMGYPI